MEPLPTPEQIKRGEYPKWDGNSEFDKHCLLALGLPEDFRPTNEQAMRIVIAALED